nr:ribonuclease H-like domain-containing protein [Tanacetum cinerariifolium]
MESLSPQVVSAAKLPILNPNEFDLWKIRIEQYFFMTDYSLWEVILNGDSPIPARVINDKHQLKFNIHKVAKSLMEAIEKWFGGNKETKKVQKTLLKQQYENFTGSSSKSLDQIHDRLQKLISQLEILEESLSQEDINMKFLRSLPIDTNELVSVVTSVSAASTKVPISALPNMDTLSDAVIYSFFMAMLTMRARRFLQRTRRNLRANGTTSIGFDMSKVECYNCHRKRHFARECRSPKDTRNKETQRRNVSVETSTSNALVSQYDGYDNQVFHSTVFNCDEMFSFESDVSMPTSLVYDRYQSAEGYHAVSPPYTGTFNPPKPNLIFYDAPTVNENVHTAFNVEPSPSKPDMDLSQSNRPSDPIIEDWVSDSKDESEGETMPTQKAPSFVHTSKHVKTPRPSVKSVEHPVPAENLRKDIPQSRGHRHSWNRKACFVCKSLTYLIKDCDYYEKKMVQKPVRNRAMRGNHQHYARMTHLNPHRHVVPITVLTRSRLVPLNVARPVTTVVPPTKVHHQRPTIHGVPKAHSPLRRPINLRPSPTHINFHQKVTTVKTNQVNAIQGVKENWGNPQHALKDKGVIDSGCSRHMTGSISYLSNFEEINGGYVAFGENPIGGKITGKGKIKTGKLDFDDVYFVKELNFNLFSISQMYDKKNNVLFIYTECIILSSDFKPSDENHFCGMKGIKREYSVARTPQLNGIAERKNRTLIEVARTMLADSLLPILFWAEVVNTTCYVQNRVLVTKPHNKTPYELLLGRTPSKGFMRPFGCLVTILNTLNPLVKFNGKADEGFLVGYSEPESEVYVSPSSSAKTQKHDDKTKREAKGKSHVELSTRVINLSEEFEDFSDNSINEVNAASTPVLAVGQNSTNGTDTFSAAALEDITYSDDEEDVGAEVDFTNLETNITVSPIPTTRVRKDHPVSQIIGDISLAPLTQSMIRMVKDQDLCKAFKKLMKNKFQMSSIGELTFFLGLQVKQKQDGIFISQDKYVAKILRKFGLTDGKLASTPIDTEKPLLKDPDVTPKALHLNVVKRIFRYLKGKPHLGLWYSKDSPFNLVAYSDSDYDRASLDRKFTTGGCQFLDSSNSLMADNLPKIVWYSTHHVALMKSWLVQKQMALGKDESNPFIVDSLLKTIGEIAKIDAYEDVTLEEVAAEVAKDAKVQGRLEESQAQVYHLDLEHAQKVLKVVTAAAATTAATTITAAPIPTASATKRRNGIVIRDLEETATPLVIVHFEPKSKDKGKRILVEEPKPLKKQAYIKQDEAYARELEAKLNANIN